MRTALLLVVLVPLACTTARGGKKSLLPGDGTSTEAVASDGGFDGTDGFDGSGDVISSPDGAVGDDAVASDGNMDVIDPPDAITDGADGTPDVVTPPDVGPDPVAANGSILVIQVETSEVQSATITAAFTTTAPTGATPIASEGGCEVFAAAGPATPPPVPSLDAGAIVLTGLATPMTLTPAPYSGGMVLYQSGLSPATTTVLGAAATVSATATGGADLPAFMVETAVPKSVTVTSPSQDNKVGAGSDLMITWIKDTATLVRIDLFVYDVEESQAAPGPVIACTINGDPGSMVVPKALLKKLPDLGDGIFGPNGYLVVGVSRVNTGKAAHGKGEVAFGVSRTGGSVAPFSP